MKSIKLLELAILLSCIAMGILTLIMLKAQR